MSLTPSTMLPLGTTAPDFRLIDAVSGKIMSLAELASPKATVIMFICNHCPYVKHVLPHLVTVAKHYQSLGIQFVAINSNDILNYPEDAPDKMGAKAEKMSFSFPYLSDETQEIAKAYHAACTPDLYVFDKQKHCVYRGRFDASTPGNKVPVTGKDLCQALDNILANKPVSDEQHPSVGCNIKWKELD